MVGLEADGLTTGGLCLLVFALLTQGVAEVVVGWDVVGLEADGLAAGGLCLLVFALLAQPPAKVFQASYPVQAAAGLLDALLQGVEFIPCDALPGPFENVSG